jgi:uncharacterized protein YdeI (YjbR/CyaY-like superfamily)
MSDIEIYLDELKNMESQLGEKAKLFTNEAIKKFVLNCLAKKVSRVDAEVKVNFADIQETKEYIDTLEEYLNNGIDYCTNTIKNADVGDLQQLASDSFHKGVLFILQNQASKISA